MSHAEEAASLIRMLLSSPASPTSTSASDRSALHNAATILERLNNDSQSSTLSNLPKSSTTTEGGSLLYNPWASFVTRWMKWDSQREQDAAVLEEAVRLASLSPDRAEAENEEPEPYRTTTAAPEGPVAVPRRGPQVTYSVDFVEEVQLASQALLLLSESSEKLHNSMMRFLEQQRTTGEWIVEPPDMETQLEDRDADEEDDDDVDALQNGPSMRLGSDGKASPRQWHDATVVAGSTLRPHSACYHVGSTAFLLEHLIAQYLSDVTAWATENKRRRVAEGSPQQRGEELDMFDRLLDAALQQRGSFANEGAQNDNGSFTRQSSFAMQRRRTTRSGSVISSHMQRSEDSADSDGEGTTQSSSKGALPPPQSFYVLPLSQAFDCEVQIFPSLLYAVVAGDHARSIARRQWHAPPGPVVDDGAVGNHSLPASLNSSPNAKDPRHKPTRTDDDEWDVIGDAPPAAAANSSFSPSRSRGSSLVASFRASRNNNNNHQSQYHPNNGTPSKSFHPFSNTAKGKLSREHDSRLSRMVREWTSSTGTAWAWTITAPASFEESLIAHCAAAASGNARHPLRLAIDQFLDLQWSLLTSMFGPSVGSDPQPTQGGASTVTQNTFVEWEDAHVAAFSLLSQQQQGERDSNNSHHSRPLKSKVFPSSHAARLWESDKAQFIAALSVGYLQNVFVARNVSVSLDGPQSATSLLRRTVLSPTGLGKLNDLGRRTNIAIAADRRPSRAPSVHEGGQPFSGPSVIVPFVPAEAPLASSFCAPPMQPSSSQDDIPTGTAFTPTGRWTVFPHGTANSDGAAEFPSSNPNGDLYATTTDSTARNNNKSRMSAAAQQQFLTPVLQRLMSNDFSPKPLRNNSLALSAAAASTSAQGSSGLTVPPQKKSHRADEGGIPLLRSLSNRLDAFRGSRDTQNHRRLGSSLKQDAPHTHHHHQHPRRSIPTAPIPTVLYLRSTPSQLSALTEALIDIAVLHRIFLLERNREISLPKQTRPTSSQGSESSNQDPASSQDSVRNLTRGVAETLTYHAKWLSLAAFSSLFVFPEALPPPLAGSSASPSVPDPSSPRKRPSLEDLSTGVVRLYEHVVSVLISSFRVLEFAVMSIHAANAVDTFSSAPLDSSTKKKRKSPAWNFGSSASSFGADELFPLVVQVCHGLDDESRAFLRACLRWMEWSSSAKRYVLQRSENQGMISYVSMTFLAALEA